MGMKSKALLDVLQSRKAERKPVWMMRQAGRYLPEYRELRAKAENFLNLCMTPAWASEITLQPLRRFDFDAAILFADILLIPMALGLDLRFKEGEGPVLQCVANEQDIVRLSYDEKKLVPVYETVARVKADLPKQAALIGFCGAPWTVACYMIDGNSRQDFVLAKGWVKQQPELLAALVEKLEQASIDYLSQQIEAGAEVLQIFDSWAGLVEGDDFKRWVIEPTRRMVAALKARYPHIPIIGFPREAGVHYAAYARETGVDAVGIDQHMDLDVVKREVQSIKPVQGNLDPELLIQGGEAMREQVRKILGTFGEKHIFNLGHGITPQTPIEHVEDMLKTIREFEA